MYQFTTSALAKKQLFCPDNYRDVLELANPEATGQVMLFCGVAVSFFFFFSLQNYHCRFFIRLVGNVCINCSACLKLFRSNFAHS
jgi:hypothetical protein